VDMKLEVVVVPVSDMERAKQFYDGLGWRLDADLGADETRVVQLTPPGSPCSIHLRAGNAVQRPFLVVDDIEKARDEIAGHGVSVGETFHPADGGQAPGPDPERRSYASYAWFSDPDGNEWALQEITERLPGRV
jgi:catechol 2,3-dioxygenase-like lactoylglutathione lyase family enzyme